VLLVRNCTVHILYQSRDIQHCLNATARRDFRPKWKPEISEMLASEEGLCCITFVAVSCSENCVWFACIALFIHENTMQNITLRHVTSLPVPRFTHLPSELGASLYIHC